MKNLVVVLMGDKMTTTLEVYHNDQVEILCLDMRNGMSLMDANTAAEAYVKMGNATTDKIDSAFNRDLWKATMDNLVQRYRQSMRAKFPRREWVKDASDERTSLGYGDWVREQVRKSKADIIIIEEGLKGL
jgi:hypothetical protein